MSREWLINVADLRRRPGSVRTVELLTTAAELGIGDDPRFADGIEMGASLQLESLTDGVVVHGHIRVPWQGTCRRCLADAHGEVDSEVRELYQLVVTDPEAFEIVGEQIDLRRLMREVAVLDAPSDPLCRTDCAGLCPVCGVDRNDVECSCEVSTTDPRWDALAQLSVEPGQ